MYKISIWLKGGGKIVENCEVNISTVEQIYRAARHAINDNLVGGGFNIKRSEQDIYPIYVANSDIVAFQIDEENFSNKFKKRKLETV